LPIKSTNYVTLDSTITFAITSTIETAKQDSDFPTDQVTIKNAFSPARCVAISSTFPETFSYTFTATKFASQSSTFNATIQTAFYATCWSTHTAADEATVTYTIHTTFTAAF
jgi:hypothetical protein